jgi:hypothetical protein
VLLIQLLVGKSGISLTVHASLICYVHVSASISHQVFVANKPSVSSFISASPSIITAIALRYEISSGLPSTISITIDTFGLFFKFLVYRIELATNGIRNILHK